MSQTQRNTFVNMREMCPAAFCSPSLGRRYRHVGLGMETFSIPPSLSQLSIKEHHRCLWFLLKHPAQEYHPTFPDLVLNTSLFQVHISEDIKRYNTLEFRSKAISVWGCGFNLHFCGCCIEHHD